MKTAWKMWVGFPSACEKTSRELNFPSKASLKPSIPSYNAGVCKAKDTKDLTGNIRCCCTISTNWSYFLACFPKMKVGLSNHQPVCLCVCVCPSLITFESNGGFSWNLVGRWFHWRWSRSHIFNLVTSAIPKWRTFKLLKWVQRNPLITFELIGGFGWNFVWRLWHWILFTVSLCRESRHISSSQNFLFCYWFLNDFVSAAKFNVCACD
jgi:hypothetical protein